MLLLQPRQYLWPTERFTFRYNLIDSCSPSTMESTITGLAYRSVSLTASDNITSDLGLEV